MKSQLQATKYCIYDLKAMMLSPVLTTKKDVGVRKKKEEESCAGIPFKGHVAVRLSGDSANLGVRERRRHTKERLQIRSTKTPLWEPPSELMSTDTYSHKRLIRWGSAGGGKWGSRDCTLAAILW